MTKSSIAATKSLFKKLDINNDGHLCLDEVCKNLKIDADLAKKELKKADKDGGGTISFEEFFLLIRMEQQKMKQHINKNDGKWKNCFKKFDKSGDGRLCLGEFYLFWKEVDPEIGRNHIELLFASTDVDGSGKICYEEFAACLNHLNG